MRNECNLITFFAEQDLLSCPSSPSVAGSHDKISGFLPSAVFGAYRSDIIPGSFAAVYAAIFLRTQHVIPDPDFRQP
jgi:hypothetical protein